MFRRRGYELAPVSGVEPLRSAFVARSPKSLGPRANYFSPASRSIFLDAVCFSA
jgi:hypothetical protein